MESRFICGMVSNRFQYQFTASPYQDGVIRGDEMFNFNDKGHCEVYSLSGKTKKSEFNLDKKEIIVPHCNAVFFGGSYAEEGDEFPLLYANIYNNYARMPDRMTGVLCAYRLMRNGDSFDTRLTQVIKIGFSERPGIWLSDDCEDIRPYGNFAEDLDSGILYAFVMRDSDRKTRFFSFRMPDSTEGDYDSRFGVPVFTLTENMIIDMFDIPYSNYLQGACCRGGKIYSLEGFCDEIRRPVMRIIDLREKKQTAYIDLWGMGLKNEPEFTDISDDVLYYRDGNGMLFSIGADSLDTLNHEKTDS